MTKCELQLVLKTHSSLSMEALFQGSCLAPSYPLLELPKSTTMLTNCVKFNLSHNPCFIFANSSRPFSAQSKPRKPFSVIVNAQKKDKKEDHHSFVSKPDESAGFFPEAVLLKKVSLLLILMTDLVLLV